MGLTDETQIEQVREIAGLGSYAEASTLTANLNLAQVTRTQTDITEWEAIRGDYTEIEKGLLGANLSVREQKLHVRNRVRVRLDLLPVKSLDESSNAVNTFESSHPAENPFCGCGCGRFAGYCGGDFYLNR